MTNGIPEVVTFEKSAKARYIIHQNIFMNGADTVPDVLYCFDLDGTIADIDHRVHYIQRPYKDRDYDKFFTECRYDHPVEFVIHLMQQLPQENIYILSGRSTKAVIETVEWLHKYEVPYNRLYMRANGNLERDEILKRDMVRDFEHNIKFIVDDRQRVVDMWRKSGFNVMQVDQWSEYNEEG